MENASKALLMAGGILIAIIVISIGVFLFLSYGEIGTNYEKNTATSEVMKYNANFTKFEGRIDITIQEIVSLISFANNNSKMGADTITQIFIGNVNKNGLDEGELTELIKENSENKYKVSTSKPITYDAITGKVNKIYFEKI